MNGNRATLSEHVQNSPSILKALLSSPVKSSRNGTISDDLTSPRKTTTKNSKRPGGPTTTLYLTPPKAERFVTPIHRMMPSQTITNAGQRVEVASTSNANTFAHTQMPIPAISSLNIGSPSKFLQASKLISSTPKRVNGNHIPPLIPLKRKKVEKGTPTTNNAPSFVTLRNFSIERVNTVNGVEQREPVSGFYLPPVITTYKVPSTDQCLKMLSKSGVTISRSVCVMDQYLDVMKQNNISVERRRKI